jgi:arylsulfatase A-like enzyme
MSRTSDAERFNVMPHRLPGIVPTLAALLLSFVASAHGADRPNIVFLYADDMTYAAVHALGNSEIQTPNLDRLVRRGTTFTHAYNQGGFHGAICVASRTMLLTGRYVWHARDLDQQFQKQSKNVLLWPERMRAAGYDTYMTGKWHIPLDPTKVFDTVAHLRPGGMPTTVPQSYDRPRDDRPDAWKPWDESLGGYWEGGRHWSAVVADDALAFLKAAEKRPNPFFLYLAFNAPHDPRQSPKSFVDRYPLEKIKLPASFLPEYPWRKEIGCVPETRDEALAPFPRTERAVKVHRQEYYAIITHLDEQIGRVLDAIDKSPEAANTYIFFTADHGLAVGNHGLIGKQSLFDHSVRVPFIAVGPRFAADKRIDAPIYLQDVAPTTLELAGAPVPPEIQFKSLLPLVAGREAAHYDAIYGAYMNLQRSVTENGYKLLLFPEVPKVLLFNLADDPDELHDLSGDPAQRERIVRLFRRLTALQPETGDMLDLAAKFPRLARSSE